MVGFGTIVASLALVTWLYLALSRGFFWHLDNAHGEAAGRTEFSDYVAAVVPARNEAEQIEPVITSLLSLTVPVTIFLVDDESTDGTAGLARQAAEKAGKADELVVIQSKPLPEGWTGKLWAMHQGIEQARIRNPAWLLLTDADVLHDPHTVANLGSIASPGSIASLGSIASHGDYDLVSFMVKLHCQSLAEKLLIPAFVYFFFMLYPPPWIRDPRHSTAGAAGGCMLVRSEALERTGGLPAIRREVIDDCALARLLKQQGGRLWLGLTDQSESLRRYETFSEIERMISRTAFNQLKHSWLLLVCAIVFMAIAYLAPFLLLFSGSKMVMFMSIAAWAIMAITYSPMVRYYRLNLAWAVSLPLAALFYMSATIHSAVKYWSGSGGEWKGRAQDVRDRRAAPLR